jgi:hypothetical protein
MDWDKVLFDCFSNRLMRKEGVDLNDEAVAILFL